MTRAAIRQNDGTKNPIHNPGGFVTFLLKHEVSLAHEATDADVDKAKLKALTLELRERYDALLIRYCEEVYAGLGAEDREHLDNLMRATLSKFELQQLENTGWRGIIYVGCRNRVMLNTKVAALPELLASVRGFLAGETVTATPAEMRALTAGLAEELQLPVKA